MIHYWECLKCTNQWTSCCFESFLNHDTPEKIEDRSRQMTSDLCRRCYLELKASNSREWHLLNEIFLLEKKENELARICGLSSDLHKQVEFEIASTEHNEKGMRQEKDLAEMRLRFSPPLKTVGTYPHFRVVSEDAF